uniref:Uncharacterized mitochondrial protein AtMg00810-like n=1 Tax=Nicotiana tabacum TaxID=4097 RepID=A0A1S3YZ64_TOBAC|nr:PREDICTED: uncharacterized mitochondrial protein AtMg00810-like [Nicotiana tabacum]
MTTGQVVTRKDLQNRFKIKDLGELMYFLGIEFSRSEKGIHMCQRKYTLELLSETCLLGGKPALTPLEFNHKLTSIEFDKVFNKENLSDDRLLEDRSGYQRIVGRLLYLTMTKPDIAFVVQVLGQFMHDPKQSHLDVAMRVIGYIKSNLVLGLFLPSTGSQKLVAFCDSEWGACVEIRKSFTCYVVKFGDALISWKSKKQGTVSRSSVEAEFRSMATTVAEIKWLVGLFKKLGVSVEFPVQLHYDSKAAIQILAHPIFHERTKHIDIDYHFVREMIQEGMIQTQHVGTREQLTDIFTKSLYIPQHDYLLCKLGMKSMFSSLSLRGSVEGIVVGSSS